MDVERLTVPTLPQLGRPELAPHGLAPSGPQAPQPGPSYYDISFLTPAPWKWEIATYFYLGGLSAGAYLLARLAERFGGDDPSFKSVTRAGTVIAGLALAPCPPLLIKDLGDPSRFHHMLRVFKPSSPMNLGAWTLTAYSGALALALLREWGQPFGDIAEPLVLAGTDAAGMPLALLLAGYTGVLLSGTSTPLWSQSQWLGPLFSASAVATGAGAISLALGALGGPPFGETPAGRALETVKLAAHAAEVALMRAFVAEAGDLAAPLTRGGEALPFWGSVGATLTSCLLGLLPGTGKFGKLAGSLLGLAGSFAMRWAMIHAGPLSSGDPEAARQSSRLGRR